MVCGTVATKGTKDISHKKAQNKKTEPKKIAVLKYRKLDNN
jgi:hypothetical protein